MDIGKIIMKKLLLSFILSLTLSFPALAINIRDTNIIHIYFDDKEQKIKKEYNCTRLFLISINS